MNFGKAFTYIFDDSNWFNKIIKPILFGLIPVVGWMVVSGYTLRTTRNVANGVENPLPECEFGEDLGIGFKYLVLMLIYSLPIWVFGLIIGLLSAGTQGDAGWLAVIGLIIFGIGYFIYLLALALITPLATANYAVEGTIKSGFAFKKFFQMLKKNIGAWLLVLLGGIIAGIISPMGSIVFVIGVLVTSMYASLFSAHLSGQAYALSNPEA